MARRRLNRWRSTVRDHTVVVGFGTKGRSAIQTVCATGLKKEQVIVATDRLITIVRATSGTQVAPDVRRIPQD